MTFATKSDFEGVFKALEFISYGIPVRPMGFGIISHPVIQSCFVRKKVVSKDWDFKEQFNIIDDNTTDEQKREYVKEQLEIIKEMAHNKIDALFYLMHKPYRLELLDFSKSYLTREDYTELLLDSFTDIEFPHQAGIKRLVGMFELADRETLLKSGSRDEFEKLPDTIIIYRGLQGKKSKVRSLSWTTDLSVAKWFAKRYSFNGKVYKAKIQKKDVFIYTDKRNEKEVIVNPFKLKEVVECAGLGIN